MSSTKERYVSIWKLGKERRLKSLINALETGKVEGLNELIDEMKNLKQTDFYENLCQTVDLGRKIIATDTSIKEIKDNSRIITLAKENLSSPSFYMPPFTDLIYFKMFYVMYTFLEAIYYTNSGSKLKQNDLMNIYMSGVDERILFALDQFDETSYKSEPTEEFFIKLKNTKWENKEDKELYKKLNKLRDHIRVEIFGTSYTFSHTIFQGTENAFLLFLAGCSAVNSDRYSIIKEDVIKAYKTYFKLMKTDITKFKARTELIKNNGYLICDTCNEYYKLQPGEFPEDFINECKCGGNLRFIKDLKEQM